MPRIQYLKRQKPEPNVNFENLNPRQVAEKVLGGIEWSGDNFGYCICPGSALHGNKTTKEHTRVYINPEYPPVVNCQHSSCQVQIDDINKRLWFESKNAGGRKDIPAVYTNDHVIRVKERNRIDMAKESIYGEIDSILRNYSDKLTGSDKIPNAPVEMFKKHLQLFSKDDVIWHGSTFDTNTFKTAADWVKWTKQNNKVSSEFISQSTFIANPTGRKKDQVTRSPFFIAEGDELDKKNQTRIINFLIAVGFRLFAVIDSGNKSLHAWFERPQNYTAEEITALMEALQCDPASTRIAQPVRVAGATNPKTNNVQELIYYNKSPEQTTPLPLDEVYTLCDLFPSIENGAEFLDEEIEPLLDVVEGLLHKGCKMIISGDSKSRKSYTLIDLGLSIASGGQFLGMNCSKGKVLYINMELQRKDMQDRIRRISKTKGYQDVTNFEVWNLRGKSESIDLMMPRFIKHIQRKGSEYNAIILDPLYKTLGNRDENSASDINDLMNQFTSLAEQTGAAIVICQHFAKGGGAGRSVNDRASGSGVFARDPDTIATMTADDRLSDEFGIEHGLILETSLRAHAPKPPTIIEWDSNGFVWKIRDDIRLGKAESKTGRKQAVGMSELFEIIGSGRSKKETIALLVELYTVSERTAYTVIKKAIDKKIISIDEDSTLQINRVD
jgi:hypothetical protein